MEMVNGKKVEDFWDISLEDGIRAEAGRDIKVYSDDGKTVELQAIVYDDQQVVLGTVKLVGVSDPTWKDFKGGKVLAFNKSQDNIIYFTLQMSHKLKLGTNIEFHIHTACPLSPAPGSDVARWVLTVSKIEIGSNFPAESTYSKNQTVTAGDKHEYTEITNNISSSSEVSAIALCSLKREGTHENDTLDADIYLLALDAHIEIETVGSRQELVK